MSTARQDDDDFSQWFEKNTQPRALLGCGWLTLRGVAWCLFFAHLLRMSWRYAEQFDKWTGVPGGSEVQTAVSLSYIFYLLLYSVFAFGIDYLLWRRR